MAEQLKLALEGVTQLTRVLPKVSRAITGAMRSLSAQATLPLAKVAKSVKALEAAAATEAVRRAVPHLETAIAEARDHLKEIDAERRDVQKRRDELARVAQEAGVPWRYTTRSDFVGPLRLDHSEQAVTVRLGPTPVGRIPAPSGRTTLAYALDVERKLKAAALAGWAEFLKAALARQKELSPSEPVRWKALVEAAAPDPRQRNRAAGVFGYRLALLVAATAPDGSRFTCTPPTLAEQRDATEVPDLHHVGELVRVVRGRLSPA
jgi:hypothetical protein